jgi:hypothetical protein
MGCGASKNAPVSQPAAGAAKTQVDRAASERSGASTVERAPSAPGRTGSDRGERAVDTAQTMSADNGQGMMLAAGAAGAAVGALAGGVPTSGMGSGMGELGKATGEALVELAKTLPFVAPVAFLLCAVASSAATASGARVVPVFPMRGSTRLPKSLWPTWSHARTHARTRTQGQLGQLQQSVGQLHWRLANLRVYIYMRGHPGLRLAVVVHLDALHHTACAREALAHKRTRAQTHARARTQTRACTHPPNVSHQSPSPGALHECEEW